MLDTILPAVSTLVSRPLRRMEESPGSSPTLSNTTRAGWGSSMRRGRRSPLLIQSWGQGAPKPPTHSIFVAQALLPAVSTLVSRPLLFPAPPPSPNARTPTTPISQWGSSLLPQARVEVVPPPQRVSPTQSPPQRRPPRNPTTPTKSLGSSTLLPQARVEAVRPPERAAHSPYPQWNTPNLTPHQHPDTLKHHARWVGVEYE